MPAGRTPFPTFLHWIPDGFKDIPVDRRGARARLKDSLDQIFAVEYSKKNLLDSVECKLFGIGMESCTVGSHEFYMNYAKEHNLMLTIDSGHFHPTEQISDKISSILLFFPEMLLHISRPIRWDSDHVVIFDDELQYIANETIRNDVSAYDVIQNLFPDKTKDFVFNITESDIVLVKEIKNNVESKDLEKLARSISDTLSGEFYTRVNVGIGTAVVGIKDLARSFKEAQIALEVGKVFDTDKVIVSYDNLGIARLIYHLPTTLCETFLQEVFKKGSIESLDHETLFTIQKFFENNLNVSETSQFIRQRFTSSVM